MSQSKAGDSTVSLEPGDRFEVTRDGISPRLKLPAVFGPSGFAIDRLEDREGRPLEIAASSATRLLEVPAIGAVP
ncbi:hypothetical protein ACYOEI_19490, partial [Singulisphaera rosea]